jgi:hypothetical protein
MQYIPFNTFSPTRSLCPACESLFYESSSLAHKKLTFEWDTNNTSDGFVVCTALNHSLRCDEDYIFCDLLYAVTIGYGQA